VSSNPFDPKFDEVVNDWLEIARRFGNIASHEANATERQRLLDRRGEALEEVRLLCQANGYPLTEQELHDLLSKAS
jgi:hypothetical protein